MVRLEGAYTIANGFDLVACLDPFMCKLPLNSFASPTCLNRFDTEGRFIKASSTFFETLALIQCNIRVINPIALYVPILVLHVTRIIYQNSKSENSEACVYKNSILLMMLTLHRRYEYNKFHSFVTLIAAVLHFPLPSLFYGLCILMPSFDGADALLKD